MRLLRNLYWFFYVFTLFKKVIPLTMTEPQLATVQQFAQAIADAAAAETKADLVVDGDNTAIANLTAKYQSDLGGLQTTLSADSSAAAAAETATQAAITALTSYVANPS